MKSFNIQNWIQKDRSYILVVVILTAIFSISYFIETPRVYATTIVQCDPSDGHVLDDGTVAQENLLKAGDGKLKKAHRIFVKFPIQSCGFVDSARLYIYAHTSVKDDYVDFSGSLSNPGLGDLIVYHINDYGTLDGGDFGAASIDNDPGVLIPGTDTVNIGYISIDVRSAMQDDVNHHRDFTTFMIRMETDTDGDTLNDFWRFESSRHPDGYGPYIEYTCTAVGGTVMASRHTQVLMYLLIVIGVVAVGGIFKALTKTYSKPSSRT